MKEDLRLLYEELDNLMEYKAAIENIESKIRHYKHTCKHSNAMVLEEGTEFDGYGRNDYYALIYCEDCDDRFEVYTCWEASKYKYVDGLTKYQCRR